MTATAPVEEASEYGIALLMATLSAKSYTEQLEFWEKFRQKHRARIASTEATLDPSLLQRVDQRISKLRPLAATEV